MHAATRVRARGSASQDFDKKRGAMMPFCWGEHSRGRSTCKECKARRQQMLRAVAASPSRSRDNENTHEGQAVTLTDLGRKKGFTARHSPLARARGLQHGDVSTGMRDGQARREAENWLALDLGGQTEVIEHGANGGVTCPTPLGERLNAGIGRARYPQRDSGRYQRDSEVW